jgi:hypothetical protein
VTQSNTVSADATASASAGATQTISLAIGSDSASALDIAAPAASDIASALSPDISQQISASQLAEAFSQASQTDASNLSVISSGILGGLSQLNSATADSTASAAFNAVETVSVGADGPLSSPASSVQSIASSQTASASAQTVQTGAFNLNQISSFQPSLAMIGTVGQANSAASFAFAVAVGSVFQVVSQFQGGTGPQSDLASQTAGASQASIASAQTSQAQVGNVNGVVIPAFGMWNPSLSQSNSIGSYAFTSSSSAIAQTVNQAVTNSSDVVGFDLQASQDGKVTQSGFASSAQAQADRVNLAGWGGVVAVPQPQQFAAPADTSQTQTVVATQTAVQSPPSLIGFVLPAALPSALPKVFPSLPPGPLATPGVARYSSSEFGLRSQTGAVEVAAASGSPATPEGPAPVCEQHCGIDLLVGAIGSARATGSGSGDPVAALSQLYTFAPPGAGRVQLEASAPGVPAFVSPFERPG